MFNLRSGNNEELVRHRRKEEGMKESLVCGEIVRCVLCEFVLLCITPFYLNQLPKLLCKIFFGYIGQVDNCGNIGSLDTGYAPGCFTTSHVEVTAYRPCPLTPEIGQQLYIDRNQILAATTALTHRLESCLVYPTVCIYINVTYHYLPKPKENCYMISSHI